METLGIGTQINETISKALAKEPEFTDVHLILYTDGGCDNTGDKLGGWGVHGYWYNLKPTKSNSGCKTGCATHQGYLLGKVPANVEKANVLAYMDYFGGVTPTPTTNNLAEMKALSKAFDIIVSYPVESVTIYIDSDYTRQGLLQWIKKWRANDWRGSNGKPIANQEEWVDIDAKYTSLCKARGTNYINILRVDGHSDDIGNDKADELATAGAWGQRNKQEVNDEFNISAVDAYWGNGGLSSMFTETRLFFDENIYNSPGNWYYQATLPYSGSETEKEKNMGKRATDLSMSVLFLNEPEVVLDSLQDYMINSRSYQGIFKGRLDYLTHITNYNHIQQYTDGRYLLFNDAISEVSSPSKAKLAKRINTARLAYRLFGEFDIVRGVLQSAYGESNSLFIKSIDITHHMYESVKKSKTSDTMVTKLNPNIGDYITIGHDEVYDIPSQVTLTLGIDLPSKVSLGRLKSLSPKVTLLLYPQSKNKYSYYVAIQTTEGVGVWCAPYSNVVLLPDNKETSS